MTEAPYFQVQCQLPSLDGAVFMACPPHGDGKCYVLKGGQWEAMQDIQLATDGASETN